jgi:hypothetical protein
MKEVEMLFQMNGAFACVYFYVLSEGLFDCWIFVVFTSQESCFMAIGFWVPKLPSFSKNSGYDSTQDCIQERGERSYLK